ncbi:hypothetical protein Bpfe_022601 [Biomphalaria pfeifferi]|uniref:Uncharacterized protein n=1 Tax=Biomphalaria pfeifferi TaxID=112525 RepID=A0AAD8B4P8_BIOPF|nr:hypothetical protein Bpfe_022601 [Biomphalaria pfeifferi]
MPYRFYLCSSTPPPPDKTSTPDKQIIQLCVHAAVTVDSGRRFKLSREQADPQKTDAAKRRLSGVPGFRSFDEFQKVQLFKFGTFRRMRIRHED